MTKRLTPAKAGKEKGEGMGKQARKRRKRGGIGGRVRQERHLLKKMGGVRIDTYMVSLYM
jgi:hypothetical protein